MYRFISILFFVLATVSLTEAQIIRRLLQVNGTDVPTTAPVTTSPVTTLPPTTAAPAMVCDSTHVGIGCLSAIPQLHLVLPIASASTTFTAQFIADFATVFAATASRFSVISIASADGGQGTYITIRIDPLVNEITPDEIVTQTSVFAQLEIDPLAKYETTNFIDYVVGLQPPVDDNSAVAAANDEAEKLVEGYNKKHLSVWVWPVVSILIFIIVLITMCSLCDTPDWSCFNPFKYIRQTDLLDD